MFIVTSHSRRHDKEKRYKLLRELRIICTSGSHNKNKRFKKDDDIQNRKIWPSSENSHYYIYIEIMRENGGEKRD